MQGIVLSADVKSGTGIICSEDGERFVFKYENCPQKTVLPLCTVQFSVSAGEAVDVYAVHTPWSARFDWLTWFLFSTKGRVSRDQFFWFLAGLTVACPLMIYAALLLMPMDVFLILPLFLICLVKICVVVKRFHDTNHSGIWLGMFIILSVLTLGAAEKWVDLPQISSEILYAGAGLSALSGAFCLYLCFACGNIGKNAFGNEPYKSYTKRLK